MPAADFDHAFALATRPDGRFGHAAHLHVIWTLLQERPALDALAEFRRGLRALAHSLGVPGKYHETVTVGWTLLVLERLERGEPWEAFAARHPELFDPRSLAAHYPAGVLEGAEARAAFVVPPAAP